MHAVSQPIPVTLVTGFLGAGKTTFLNHLLSADHGAKLGVIINEVDPVGVDRDLVVNTNGQLVEMNNGCLCCTVEGDLKDVVANLLKAGSELEGLVIETTGLANPGPIAQAFFADPYLCEATRLDAIVTVVDAYHVRHLLMPSEQSHDEASTALAQLGYADVLLLNKTDLVSTQDLIDIEAELRRLNPLATLVRTTFGVVPVQQVTNRRAFEFDGRLEALRAEVALERPHRLEMRSVSFRFAEPFDQIKLNTFLCHLLRDHGSKLYRCKGVLHVRELSEPLVFQGVGSLFATSSGVGSSGQPLVSKAVFIGRDLDDEALRKGLESCLARS